MTGLFAYNPCCDGAVGAIVTGSGNTVQGIAHIQSGSANTVGVQLGTSDSHASGNTVLMYVSGWNNGSYDLTYDDGANFVIGNNSNTGTPAIGSFPVTDTALLIGAGSGALNRGRISNTSGLLSEGFSTLGSGGQHGVNLADTLIVNSSAEIIPALPTTCSGHTAGTLWNNAGTVKVC